MGFSTPVIIYTFTLCGTVQSACHFHLHVSSNLATCHRGALVNSCGYDAVPADVFLYFLAAWRAEWKGSHRDECYRMFLSANRWIQPSPHVRAQKRGRLPHCGTMSWLTREQSAPFSSANRRAVPYEMNTPQPPHTLFLASI